MVKISLNLVAILGLSKKKEFQDNYSGDILGILGICLILKKSTGEFFLKFQHFLYLFI